MSKSKGHYYYYYSARNRDFHAAQMKCKPTLRQLYLILVSIVAFIVCCLYILKERTGKHLSLIGLGSDYESDYLILPKTLPVAARLLTVLIFLPYAKVDSRMAIRNSWASTRQKYNASVFFVLDRPSKSTTPKLVGIEDEANFFSDIIQTNVEENENNEAAKRLKLALRFVESNLLTSYVMKVDENCFVNLPHTTNYLTSLKDTNLFLTSSKTYLLSNYSFGVSLSLSPKPVLYVMSVSTLKKFLLCSNEGNSRDFNELSTLVHCFHKYDIVMKNSANFALNVHHISSCLIRKNFITHPVSVNDMETFWLDLRQNKLNC